MNDNEKSIADTLRFLNDLYSIDPDAIKQLIEFRVNCNKLLANHETVQVKSNDDNTFSVGLLGILNGLFGAHSSGNGYISAEYFEDSLDGFVRTPGTEIDSDDAEQTKENQ